MKNSFHCSCDFREKEEDRAKVCYHLAFAKEDKGKNLEYDGPIVARVKKAEKSFECDKVDVCKYGQMKTPGPDIKDQQQQQQPEIRYPDSCAENSTGMNGFQRQLPAISNFGPERCLCMEDNFVWGFELFDQNFSWIFFFCC